MISESSKQKRSPQSSLPLTLLSKQFLTKYFSSNILLSQQVNLKIEWISTENWEIFKVTLITAMTKLHSISESTNSAHKHLSSLNSWTRITLKALSSIYPKSNIITKVASIKFTWIKFAEVRADHFSHKLHRLPRTEKWVCTDLGKLDWSDFGRVAV